MLRYNIPHLAIGVKLTLLEALLKQYVLGVASFTVDPQMNPGDRRNPCVEKMRRCTDIPNTERGLKLLDGCKGYFGSQHTTYLSHSVMDMTLGKLLIFIYLILKSCVYPLAVDLTLCCDNLISVDFIPFLYLDLLLRSRRFYSHKNSN